MIDGLKEEQKQLRDKCMELEGEQLECGRKGKAYDKEVDQISNRVVSLRVCMWWQLVPVDPTLQLSGTY